MGRRVVLNGSVFDLVKVVEPEAHALGLGFGDWGIEYAAEDGNIG